MVQRVQPTRSWTVAAHKVLGLTLDPKLTYNAHIQNIATHTQKPLQVIKALTGTTWGKQKKALVATYKAVTRPTLEYASSIWSPMASLASINKLQVMQNSALRACTGCTHDTNIHLHDETYILPIQKHNYMHRKSDKKHNTHHIHSTDTRVGVKYSTCTWYLYLSTYLSVLDVLEYLVYGNAKVLVLVLVLDQNVLGTYK